MLLHDATAVGGFQAFSVRVEDPISVGCGSAIREAVEIFLFRCGDELKKLERDRFLGAVHFFLPGWPNTTSVSRAVGGVKSPAVSRMGCA